MSTPFESFQSLFLKVIATKDAKPFQWIYAVDDAWLHPDKWSLTLMDKKCLPVFPSSLGTEVDVDNSDLKKALDANGGGADDTETARLLIEFVQKRQLEGLNYGICFCSFEYFWHHINEINEPQNAVFFDLRHQMAANGQVNNEDKMAGLLRDAWADKLASCSLLGDSGFEMSMLGWYLHYALKFSCVNSMSFRHIANNHILIISSAISPRSDDQLDDPGTPRNAISQYLQIQEAIWRNLTPQGRTDQDTAEDKTLGRLKPEDFTFSPLPKNFGPGQIYFQTGLLIFNNSFKTAGQWDKIHELFIHDINMVYAAPTAIAECGHFGSGSGVSEYLAKFKWRGWFPDSPKSATDPLYINTNHQGYSSNTGGKIHISTLLNLFSHSGLREFPRTVDGYGDWMVDMPTRPGFVFVYLLLDFVNSLSPKEDRDYAKISYNFDDADEPEHFEIRIFLPCECLKELESCYTNGTKRDGNPCGNVTNALWLLGSKKHFSANKNVNDSKLTMTKLARGKINFDSKYPIIDFSDAEHLKIKLQTSKAPPA